MLGRLTIALVVLLAAVAVAAPGKAHADGPLEPTLQDRELSQRLRHLDETMRGLERMANQNLVDTLLGELGLRVSDSAVASAGNSSLNATNSVVDKILSMPSLFRFTVDLARQSEKVQNEAYKLAFDSNQANRSDWSKFRILSFSLSTDHTPTFGLDKLRMPSFQMPTFDLGKFRMPSFPTSTFDSSRFRVPSFPTSTFDSSRFRVPSFPTSTFDSSTPRVPSLSTSTFDSSRFPVPSFPTSTFDSSRFRVPSLSTSTFD
jgi:hypothetical protein